MHSLLGIHLMGAKLLNVHLGYVCFVGSISGGIRRGQSGFKSPPPSHKPRGCVLRLQTLGVFSENFEFPRNVKFVGSLVVQILTPFLPSPTGENPKFSGNRKLLGQV